MKAWIWISMLIVLTGMGCGKRADDESMPATQSEELDIREVIGSAKFGSHCPYGTYNPPQPVPVDLRQCPISAEKLELSDALPSVILHADCKKKLIDVRSEGGAFPITTWEIMPDGNFYFAIDGGVAKIKDGGTGTHNCSAPLLAEMWGYVDCSDRDRAITHIESYWWIGKTLGDLPQAPPAPSISPRPSDSPSAQPSARASSLPVSSPATRIQGPVCKMPAGCYFRSRAQVQHCP